MLQDPRVMCEAEGRVMARCSISEAVTTLISRPPGRS